MSRYRIALRAQGGMMVATRVVCMDVLLLFASGGKPKTEEGRALFENHRKSCRCVAEIIEKLGDKKLPMDQHDKGVLQKDFGPCDFPEMKDDRLDIGFVEILAILAKYGKM